MAEFVNVYVTTQAGRKYRVAFHVGCQKVMCVMRQGLTKETALDIDGPTGAAVVELARPKFKALIGATGGKR